MSQWIEVSGPGNHRVQILDDGGVLWEHDTLPGYWTGRHQVSPSEGERWEIVQASPLTLSPSLHCATDLGGCGMHGFVRDGHWT